VYFSYKDKKNKEYQRSHKNNQLYTKKYGQNFFLRVGKSKKSTLSTCSSSLYLADFFCLFDDVEAGIRGLLISSSRAL
jgi:hypothetical protein